MAEVVLKQLSFRYPGSAVETLSALDLSVARGEAHALLGGSGAGKSTLLNLLSGLLPAAAGQVYFDGQDVSELTPWSRRVTQVFQFPVLYDGMTVAENLSFPMRDASRQSQRERVTRLAAELNITTLLNLRPPGLTLVQKQLVAIGKALMRPDVSLVLLDEPLTAAEPEHKWQLRQTLRSLQRELGATMIYVTHDQAEALTFADRVSILHEGRILQTATPQTLLEQPAHEHVGHFVGSPGMNLLDGEIRNGCCLVGGVNVGRVATADLPLIDGACRVGFRPEWAQADQEIRNQDVRRPESHDREIEGMTLDVMVRGLRTLTIERGQPHGLVVAEFQGVEVISRQALGNLTEGPARLLLDTKRLVCFRDGWSISRMAGRGTG